MSEKEPKPNSGALPKNVSPAQSSAVSRKTIEVRSAQVPASSLGSAETSPRWAQTIRRLLLAAYDAGKRSLPWREESDPYRVWVSEVMLQQTRVDTVIPYYEKWVERFPSLEALAAADEDEVLRLWQGLGYYSRARRLREGAQVVLERYGGDLPRDSEGLRELPGVGEYTAGAVASIAYGEIVPAVDGNVRRVLSRLFDLPTLSPVELRRLATTLVDPDRPGDFNQALMELGAMVCVPRTPLCEGCPLAGECLALERGTVSQRPAPKPKKAVPEVSVVVLVAMARDHDGRPHFLMKKRPDAGLLAGMWGFPGMEVEGASAGASGTRKVVASLARSLGLPGPWSSGTLKTSLTELDVVSHAFSHRKVRYRPFLLRTSHPIRTQVWRGDARWISEEVIHGLPIPVAQQKILRVAKEYLAD